MTIWENQKKPKRADRICFGPKCHADERLAPVWPERTPGGALPLAAHSPVELVVVVMRLPPEVEPDEQQTEGEEEDEGPQKLPLQEKTHAKTRF